MRYQTTFEKEEFIPYLNFNGVFCHFRGPRLVKPNKTYMIEAFFDKKFATINEVEDAEIIEDVILLPPP